MAIYQFKVPGMVRCPMARVLLLIAVSFIALLPAHGQYFKPFTLTSKKLFAANEPVTLGYSMAFDSAFVQEGDSIFHHYMALNDTSATPYFDCYKEDVPIWDGTLFRTDNAGTYWFRTIAHDTLRFELDLPVGGISTFFENDLQRFSIEKGSVDTMTILGHLDSIITYTIHHTDVLGEPINSPLTEWQMMIGKDLGLIQFFQIDSFPQVLRPLVLEGNKGPDVGLHRITPAVVHDHDIGDVIQRQFYSGNISISPQYQYTKLTILSRTETDQAVVYQMDREILGPGSNDFITDQVTESHSKQTLIGEIPFDRFAYDKKTLYRDTSLCGAPIWQYHIVSSLYLFPNEQEDCWEAIGAPGPGIASHSTHQLGVGISSHTQYQDFNGPYYGTRSGIAYFKKNGSECGNEIILGIRDIPTDRSIKLYPNPALDAVRIESNGSMEKVELLDATGRMIMHDRPYADRISLDLSEIKPGQYVARVCFDDGIVIHQQLVKIK